MLADILIFDCPSCASGLEAAPTFAGVLAPCPVCGAPVRAPLLPELPSLRHRTGTGPAKSLQATPSHSSSDAQSALSASTAPPPAHFPPVAMETSRPPSVPGRFSQTPPPGGPEPKPIRQQQSLMRPLDTALVLVVAGLLLLMAVVPAFTTKQEPLRSSGTPQLSEAIVQRMHALEQKREAAVLSARVTLRNLATAPDWQRAEPFLIPFGQTQLRGAGYPLLAGGGDLSGSMDLVQTRRLPGTERFLMIFESASPVPLLIPVEETSQGCQAHWPALHQQLTGSLPAYLSSGHGEGFFYVLLRPAPLPMIQSFLQLRPELGTWILASLEPAFPADGALGGLAAILPGSPAAADFSNRSRDPGLRPAVVSLLWRHPDSSPPFMEITTFHRNAWSRHTPAAPTP